MNAKITLYIRIGMMVAIVSCNKIASNEKGLFDKLAEEPMKTLRL